MSDTAEKMKAPEPKSDNIARARLKQLQQRWGARGIWFGENPDTTKTPDKVEISGMGGLEIWEREGRDDGGWWFRQAKR